MDRADLIAYLPQLKRELNELRIRMTELELERDALRTTIAGIERLAAGTNDAATVQLDITVESADAGHERDTGDEIVHEQPAPRGVEAVRRLLSDGRKWKLQAIIAEIIRRGWIKPDAKDPENAIREAVRKLASLGEIERVDFATYQMVPAALPTDPAANGSAEVAEGIGVQT